MARLTASTFLRGREQLTRDEEATGGLGGDLHRRDLKRH
jgi:hypothetical protein